jgi:hypothetical protein
MRPVEESTDPGRRSILFRIKRPRRFCLKRVSAFATALIVVCVAPAVHGQGRPAPIQVKPFRGKYCASVGPPGWAVISENAQRVAFGADFSNGNGTAYVGYGVFGGGSLAAGVPGYETPDSAVTRNLSNMGSTPTRFGNRQQLGPNVFLMEYQSATNHGVAYWQVIPAGNRGFMIVLRTAGTGAAAGLWQRKGPEAMAVARSMRCQVPNVPASPDPPSLNAKSKSGGGKGGEDDTLYNRWLDKEYYHNSQTGENYWVSPSQDWVQNGPEGPGYYAQHGNGTVKLDPGYSR